MDLHIGHGIQAGPLTVFPLWQGATDPGTTEITVTADVLLVAEMPSGPQVGHLSVTNVGVVPALIPDGQLFDGGWQHRVACGSVLVPPGAGLGIDVACVERHRWDGSHVQRGTSRRAAPSVRDGARVSQGEAWARVERHTAGRPNPTASLVRRMDAGDLTVPALRPLPGQTGVVVGVAGQPLLAEVFASPQVLSEQLPWILEAAALDAALLPPSVTPSRRARRFVGRFSEVSWLPTATPGWGRATEGASEYVHARSLAWPGPQQAVHAYASNRHHPLLAVA